jgi:cathepsin L
MMKTLLVLVVLVSAACALSFKDKSGLRVNDHWQRFKVVHNRNYGRYEEYRRKTIFASNLRVIMNHNIEADLGVHTFRLGVNQFADLTTEEFKQQVNGYRSRATPAREQFQATFAPVPDTVDWRDKNLVTPVKNQGQCGSCWAFSAVAGLEGQHAKATGKLVSLSEQNLVDCSQPEGNQGCNGGLMDSAFEYIEKNGGVDTESSYPYEAKDDTCRFNKGNVGATLKSWVDIKSGDEEALKEASATVGPISVAIDAGTIFFQLYFGGVYNDPICKNGPNDLDHGVTVVGYGTDSGKDFWLVKNSWGASWGEKGYIRMSRNKKNQCGIATQASYPVV